MGKNPAFQFYPNDWLGDNQLQMASTVTKGVWIQLLCRMWWSDTRGRIEGTREELCKIALCTMGEIETFLCDAVTLKFASVTLDNKNVTVVNRRMEREEQARKSNVARQARYRDTHRNAHMTVPSPSPSTPSPSTPSSSPSTKRKILLCNPDGFARFWEVYPKKKNKGRAERAWNKIQPQNGLAETIVASVIDHIQNDQQWEEYQYIPFPEAYLNAKGWEDVILFTHKESTAQRLWREAQEERNAAKGSHGGPDRVV